MPRRRFRSCPVLPLPLRLRRQPPNLRPCDHEAVIGERLLRPTLALACGIEPIGQVARDLTLAAELGPAARYRAFLAAARGDVRLVLGTRGAVFAPVADLGLMVVWDEGNDVLAEPRAPYYHAREVAALRASAAHCGLLLAGFGRTAEAQAFVQRGWAAPIALDAREARRLGPAVRVAA